MVPWMNAPDMMPLHEATRGRHHRRNGLQNHAATNSHWFQLSPPLLVEDPLNGTTKLKLFIGARRRHGLLGFRLRHVISGWHLFPKVEAQIEVAFFHSLNPQNHTILPISCEYHIEPAGFEIFRAHFL